jgi:Fur family zinc uptake transcriptional regulator
MVHQHACDHHHDAPGIAERALVSELDAASVRCERVQEKLTPGRRRVLELLLRTGRPAKAYDLIAQFGEDGTPAKPPTVYRALEFLERQGLAHRIESLNAYVACRHGDRPHVAAFLICDCCHTSREVETAGAPDLIAAGVASGFTLKGVTIEGHGLCADCTPATVAASA